MHFEYFIENLKEQLCCNELRISEELLSVAKCCLEEINDDLTEGNYDDFTEDNFIRAFSKSFAFCHEKWEVYCLAEFVETTFSGFNDCAKFFWRVYFANLPDSEELMELIATEFPLDRIDDIYSLILGIPVDSKPRSDLIDTISAFNAPFANPEIALDHYRDFVRDKIMKEYNEHYTNYHSLYFTVVQSHGYGKTRLLLEAGRGKLHTVYACLRPEYATKEYPLGNWGLKYMLDSVCRSVSQAELFLAVTYYVAMVILGCFEPDELPKDIRIPRNISLQRFEGGGTEGKFVGVWNLVSKIMSTLSVDKLNAIKMKVMEAQVSFSWAERHGNYSKAGDFYCNGTHRFPSEIVVVFDDAKFLLNDPDYSFFRVLISAQQKMKFRNMVLVFVDTMPMPAISCYNRPYHHDHDARPYRIIKLLPVYYQVLTYDSLIIDGTDGRPTQQLAELAQVFSLGRPDWKARFFSNKSIFEHDIKGSINYAMGKFSNKPDSSIYGSNFVRLAVASIVFGIWGITDHHYATELLSNHLATALYISDDRSIMFVNYVSEPIVAEAAHQLLYRMNEKLEFPGFYLKQVLADFEQCVVSGLVDVGNFETLVCRMILSFVYAKAHIDMPKNPDEMFFFSNPISVGSFLDLLVCPDYQAYYQDHFKVPCYNLEHASVAHLRTYGEIAFTSFELLYSLTPLHLTHDYLKRAFEHRVAFVGRDKQRGCDLVIPVRITEQPGPNPKYSYSALIVKMQNYKKPPSPMKRSKAASIKLTPAYIEPDSTIQLERYISIYMELDFCRSDSIPIQEALDLAKDHFDAYGNHIVIFDQSSMSFLDNQLKDMLKSLAGKTADYIGKAANKEALKVMCPMRFGID